MTIKNAQLKLNSLLLHHNSLSLSLYSMIEISSCHMELATNTRAMTQLSNIIQCPSIEGEAVVNVAIVCLILSYTMETHSYLVEAGLVKSFLAPLSTLLFNENKILYR